MDQYQRNTGTELRILSFFKMKSVWLVSSLVDDIFDSPLFIPLSTGNLL